MKKQLLSLLVLLSAPTFAAQEINVQALQACSFIENDFNRLLCYDNTVAGKPLTKPSEKKIKQRLLLKQMILALSIKRSLKIKTKISQHQYHQLEKLLMASSLLPLITISNGVKLALTVLN